jgi:TonB family protein
MSIIHRNLVLLALATTLAGAQPITAKSAGPLALTIQELPDRQPQATKTATPGYPEVLKRAGIQGEAFITLSIDATGKVDSASVLRATHEGFGQAAKAAAMKWEFSPALRNGKPIRSDVVVPFKFKLSEDEEFYGLVTVATDILRGKATQQTAAQIYPDAYAFVGHTYASLQSILFDKTPAAKLVEGEKTNVVFTAAKSDEAKKTVVLMLQTGAPDKKVEHCHTVVFMKSSDGLWKIRSWHASQ